MATTYPHIFKGFLFGHYDSRGGATFIEAPDRDEANQRYLQVTCLTYEDLDWLPTDEEKVELQMGTLEEDFISAVTLESYRELTDGEDIEWLEDGPDIDELHRANAFDDGLQWAGEAIESTTANPYCELLWWHRESATLRLCPKGVNPGHPEESYGASYGPSREDTRIPGWIRSNFGEDACGVIFCAAE